ncbi:MAG: hypothetical protein P8101_01075 [Candidatus Thiodiazotropha sp.]
MSRNKNRRRPMSDINVVPYIDVMLVLLVIFKPKTPVMVRGDRGVAYGRVIQAMVLLQEGGAPSVGLVTETPES